MIKFVALLGLVAYGVAIMSPEERKAAQNHPDNSGILYPEHNFTYGKEQNTDEIALNFLHTAIRRGAAVRVKDPHQVNVTNGCQLHEYIIDIRKIPGFNFVLSPERFNIGVCSGSCDLEAPATIHDQLLMLESIHAKSNCVVDQYTDAKVLYVSAFNDVRITRIPNLMATSCKCAWNL